MSRLDVLAIGPHPDDVELGCGGTVALLAAQGKRVGILHLTSGEAGTRGTARERRHEAAAAAAALGAVELSFVDCGDGSLRTGKTEEDAIIAVLRQWRPRLVLGPAPADRHPDHGRGHRLVDAACFYSGLASRGADDGPPPHRPAAIFSYMQHDPFSPRFIVDVSSTWEAKMAALDCYASQLHGPRQDEGEESAQGPVTKVSTVEFRLAMEGRARHFGNMIGAAFGEPFWSRLPVAVGDPLALIPGGVL